MGFFDFLKQKQKTRNIQETSVSAHRSAVDSFKEKDNVGTRLENVDQGILYWTDWRRNNKIPPFVAYTFNSMSDAEQAIMQLSYIKMASDTPKIIAMEPIYFGYFENPPGWFEVLVCGESFTQEMHREAMEKLAAAGGRLKDHKESTKKGKAASTKDTASSVSTLRTYHKGNPNGTKCTYYIYRGPNKDAAIAYLKTIKLPIKPLVYHIVETSDGNFGKDKDGIYEEN